LDSVCGCGCGYLVLGVGFVLWGWSVSLVSGALSSSSVIRVTDGAEADEARVVWSGGRRRKEHLWQRRGRRWLWSRITVFL
jgi:hypothetical protein